MDVFYPLRTNGSKHDNQELRYSLRALEKNVSGFDRVFISTEHLPDWLQNVVHIPVKDDPQRVPDFNIQNKICQADGISDDFLFMNDDHFIMKPHDVATFPNYYHSTLDVYCHRRGKDGYGRRCINTMNWLIANDLKLLHFDIHFPIRYNIHAFRELMSRVDWNEKHGFVIKSLYGNAMHLPGTYIKDMKVNLVPANAWVFSTYTHVKNSIFLYLEKCFPHKSKYER